MTTKSIQQRAEEYLQSESYFNEERPSEIAKDAYTAGATDERRELGRVILEMADALTSMLRTYASFNNDGRLCPRSTLADNLAFDALNLGNRAELIATLRGELK